MNVSEKQKQHVRNLLIAEQKIAAIKYIRKNFGLKLKEAKRLADLIDQDIEEDEYQYDRQKTIRSIGKTGGRIVGFIFAGKGGILLVVAFFIFNENQRIISHGVKVEAKVVSTPSNPLFQYSVNDNLYEYQSSVTSNPPSYQLGEIIAVYVNPDDPYDILVDTFTDRWLGITIVGGIGAIFFAVGITVAVLLKSRL